MRINNEFFMEVPKGKVSLSSKAQKRHATGITVQRKRTTMSNQGQFVRQTAMFLLAFCLIPGLLPGVAVSTVSAADINIINFGAIPNDTIHDTNAIQAAINAAGNGDRVIVPAGKFIISTIYVKSNMTLYLSEGAVLESSANWRDFSDPWNWRNAMIKGRTGNTLANFTIEGPGIIDGVDLECPDGEEGIRGPHTIYLSGYLSASSASNIRIAEITIRNSGNYAIFTNNVNGLTIENVKIRGGWDGFDINHSTDITVTGCDFRTSDDCIAGVGLQDVQILNSRFNSSMQGIRIGGDNVVIRDCEFYGPGEYEHRVHKTTLSRTAIHPPDWDRGQPRTPYDNCLIENCTFSGIREAYKYLKGANGFGVRGVTFNNVTVIPPENSNLPPIAIRGEEARVIINGGDFSAGSNSPTIIDIRNFDHLELHDVTLRIDGNRPAIRAATGDTVWLDRVKLVPESNVKPFDLTGIATLLYDRATGSNYYAPRIEFTDSVSGLPVEGIEVSLQGYGGKYKTDAQGMISIPVILGGSYELKISDSRFVFTENPVIEIQSDSLFRIQVKRMPQLTLRVINKTSGDPVSRASVIAEGNTYVSDASGFVNISSSLGTFIALVEHKDYFQVSDTLLVLVDTTILIPLTPKRANVTFSFSDINGPMSNVKVTMSGFSQFTNSSGIAFFSSQPAREKYSWSAEKSGYYALQDSFHLETDTTLQVTLELGTMVQEKPRDKQFLVYPNPAYDYLVIDKEIPLAGPVKIELVNVSGISVFPSQEVTLPYRLRMKGINPGIYFLKIHSPEGFSNQIITVK